MFNPDFYPTPEHVIERMLQGYNISGKVCFDPEGGKGDIIDYLKTERASSLLSCEINQDLKKILQTKCRIVADDFLIVESHQISHVDFIVMNPPFSADEKHILHAFDIAPAGCNIIALANLNTVEKCLTENRRRLRSLIQAHGSYENLGECFSNAQRITDVEIALIKLQKPGENYNSEFEGFFTDEEPEESGENGLMSYNFVRDLVNRYVAAVKLFDQQLELAAKMNDLTHDYFFANKPELGMSVTRLTVPVKRNEFKKDMQKAGWKFIFEKMNTQKYATRGLKDDINKFVEQQTSIPFTMKNIYKMLEIVIGTQSSRMDKAIIEVFEKLTHHTHENRFSVEGWKTNSHYLINQKFIMPGLCYQSRWNIGDSRIETSSHGDDTISDFVKALCHINGTDYDTIKSFYSHTRDHVYGEKFEYAFFNVRCFKKGTAHFEFKDIDLWAKFNQHVSRIKGYPLFEHRDQTAWQKKQNKKAA